MAPVGHRSEESERYRAILEAAARLICERGYDSTSMQDIATACGLTKAGLYHHVQSKEQLLFAIMQYGMDVFEERVLSRAEPIADPLERLRTCMQLNIELVTRGWSKEVTIILHEHATLTGEPSAIINQRKKRYVRFLEETVAEAVRRGQVRPVEPLVTAYSLLGMVLWIYKWYRPDGRLTVEQISEGMVNLLLSGLLPPGAVPAGQEKSQ